MYTDYKTNDNMVVLHLWKSIHTATRSPINAAKPLNQGPLENIFPVYYVNFN